MVKGIIGKKVGMTQLFDESGKVIPVTVIEAGPCTVVQKKTVESDGYQAVQLGFGEVSAKKVNKAAAGHFKKANVAPKKTLREFRLEDVSAMNVGDVLKADVFAAGDKVDVVGVSKGKGYQGVIKRYGSSGLLLPLPAFLIPVRFPFPALSRFQLPAPQMNTYWSRSSLPLTYIH